jgi:hypothetical protein
MIVWVIAAGVVAYPAIIFCMDMRGVRVICLVAMAAALILVRRMRLLLRRLRRTTIGILLASWCWTACRWGACGTVCRDMSIADAAFAATALSVALRLLGVGLWLLGVCLWLLPVLLASALGKGGDGSQR